MNDNLDIFQLEEYKNISNANWKVKSLKNITKKWLTDFEIPNNWVCIDNSPKSYSIFGLLFGIPKSQFKNSFYHTNKKTYRYFIEDTPENAIKLSSSCEYVFLIEHPYNNEINFSQPLPKNIFRVKNWNEIKNKIKELG